MEELTSWLPRYLTALLQTTPFAGLLVLDRSENTVLYLTRILAIVFFRLVAFGPLNPEFCRRSARTALLPRMLSRQVSDCFSTSCALTTGIGESTAAYDRTCRRCHNWAVPDGHFLPSSSLVYASCSTIIWYEAWVHSCRLRTIYLITGYHGKSLRQWDCRSKLWGAWLAISTYISLGIVTKYKHCINFVNRPYPAYLHQKVITQRHVDRARLVILHEVTTKAQ